MTVFAPIVLRPPFRMSQQMTPWQRPLSSTSFQAKNSSYVRMSRFITCS
jgi:hypothetical protein